MRLSQILLKQHIGRQARRHWYIQGKCTPIDMHTEKALTSKGITVIDAQEIFKPERKKLDFKNFNFFKPQPLLEDNTHPNWKDNPCFVYEDNDLLVDGLPQAQVITNTVVFENTLPDAVESLSTDVRKEVNELVQRIAKTSVIFDANQNLLPKLKDPNRPAWNFPRQYGITDARKASNLTKKLIQLCDCICGPQTANSKSVIDNALLSYPFQREFDLLQFTLTMDVMLMSNTPLRPAGQVNKEDHSTMELPSIYPLLPLIGLKKKHIYEFKNLYPLVSGYHMKNLHTIFVYHDKTEVKNLTELETTETQIFARALLKAFTATTSTARHKFGVEIKELPEPITVQCVQTDGKAFYFSVYQLNTLNVDGQDSIKNYYWTLPKMNLYEIGGYVEGKPVLDGYNPDVFKRILAFYKNN